MRRVIGRRLSHGAQKRGQVWVETVIYTLIGLAVIGLVLAGALPKIQEKKDEIAIGRSIEALGAIDDKVYGVSSATGERRVINLDIKRGALIVNPKENTISWILDSSFEYSEVGKNVSFGNMNIRTTESGDYEVELKLEYTINLTYAGGDIKERRLDTAPVPYRIIIENVGKDDHGNVVVDIMEV